MLDLVEYMKNNNANEKYDDIIKKIERKELNEPSELI